VASPHASPGATVSGSRHRSWKGGRKLERGYVVVLSEPGGRYVREHRAVAEKLIGRPLRPSEVVHHVNGDLHSLCRGETIAPADRE
jgi:hypothetical protein